MAHTKRAKGALLQLLFERDNAVQQAEMYKRFAEEGASFRVRYEASQEALTEALAECSELSEENKSLAYEVVCLREEKDELLAAVGRCWAAATDDHPLASDDFNPYETDKLVTALRDALVACELVLDDPHGHTADQAKDALEKARACLVKR